ncbi:MAG: hypothetical protein COC15_05075 [Legionellales bacterium]|nr:MAG: hypothetical protein COC15_05075 [Legionellales bacterium]
MEIQLQNSYIATLQTRCLDLLHEVRDVRYNHSDSEELAIANRLYRLAVEMCELYNKYAKHNKYIKFSLSLAS